MSANPHRLRVAAVGDIHVHENSSDAIQQVVGRVSHEADVLALCGDLTHLGLPEEAERLARDLRECRIPVVAVLGNHDYQSGRVDEVKKILKAAKVTILDGSETFELNGVGFAGGKGFGGGFDKHMLTPFGEDAIKHFVTEAVNESLKLEVALQSLRTDRVVVVLHYAPIAATVARTAGDFSFSRFVAACRNDRPFRCERDFPWARASRNIRRHDDEGNSCLQLLLPAHAESLPGEELCAGGSVGDGIPPYTVAAVCGRRISRNGFPPRS